MTIIAVDLAAKYSAACHMSLFTVYEQWDSWQVTETQFIDFITDWWHDPVDPPTALLIEDLPHGVPYMTVTKDVCRLQGRIVERMDSYGYKQSIVFIPPNEWRRHFHLKQGMGPEVVVETAAALGYQAPDLSARIGKGDKATARKVTTDYCAAYLIGIWAQEMFAQTGSYDLPRTSRYSKL